MTSRRRRSVLRATPATVPAVILCAVLFGGTGARAYDGPRQPTRPGEPARPSEPGEPTEPGAPAESAETVAPEGTLALYVPRFSGPDELGASVATVLNLQVFQTLRRSAGGARFGDAVVQHGAGLEAQSHEAAVQAARREPTSDLVLWGEVHLFGGRYNVQPHLSVADGSGLDGRPLWPIVLPDGGQVGVGLPRAHFVFTPLVLKPAVVDHYRQLDALVAHSRPGGRGTVVGPIGHEFRALVQGTGSVKVRTESGREGYLHLPGLAQNRSEVVDFVAGLLRVMRGDWGGAPRFLHRVATDRRVAPSLRADAHLLLAMCEDMQGRSGLEHVERAGALVRDAQPVARYRLAALLGMLGRAPAGRQDVLRAKLRDTLSRTAHLFDAHDPFVWHVRQLLAVPADRS